MGLVLITRQKSFIDCSLSLQLDLWNFRLTKWSVLKAIWQSEKFPDCNMMSAKGFLKANFTHMDEFLNREMKKYLVVL